MEDKCCCGCFSLYAATIIALAFACAKSLVNIFINVELLLLISENALFNPSYLVININTVEDFDVFHGIVLSALGLNAFWFAFGIYAAAGNINQSHGRLTPWIFLTYLITFFEFGVTVYFAIKFQNSFSETSEFYHEQTPTKTLTYMTLLCIYSGGGILLFFNFFLAHVVERRGKEIDRDYSTLVLYILSHMGRCTHSIDEMQQNLLPEAPPSYTSRCPPYLPQEIYQRTNEIHGSSWSLSYEALKNIGTGQMVPTGETNDMRRNVLRGEHLASLTDNNASTSYQPLNVDSNESSALPY